MVPAFANSAGEKFPVRSPKVGTVARSRRIEKLIKILVSREEEQLIPILIESGEGKFHRTAQGESRAVILVFRFRYAAILGYPVIGVHDSVPVGERRRALPTLAATLGHRAADTGTLRALGVAVR